MQFLYQQTKSVSWLVAFLFFVGSAGFTSVVHVCLMGTGECCAMSGSSDRMACQEEGLPAHELAVKGQLDCHINTVAGGLNDNPTVVEKQIRPQSPNGAFVGFALSQTLAIPKFNKSITVTLHSRDVSPPSVEKYVLNGTFLI